MGVHLSTVMSWSRRFDVGTAEATEVASARRGRRFGEGRTLELVDGPAKRAIEQRPAEVRRWLEHDYAAIARQARAEDGEIHWADETALR